MRYDTWVEPEHQCFRPSPARAHDRCPAADRSSATRQRCLGAGWRTAEFSGPNRPQSGAVRSGINRDRETRPGNPRPALSLRCPN